MIFFQQFKYLFGRITRNLYWILNSMKVKQGSGNQFGFPLIIEGKGNLRFGSGCKVERGVIFKMGTGSNLNFGNAVTLYKGTELWISPNMEFSTGEAIKIQSCTRMYVNNTWKFGNRITIGESCQLLAREPEGAGRLIVGDHSNIGDYSMIDLCNDVIIGNYVALGPRCILYTHDHEYSAVNLLAPWKGKALTKPIVIEDGVWIGANVTIMPGVTIGSRAIIAAGSVVNKNIPGSCIAGGVPVRVIKDLTGA